VTYVTYKAYALCVEIRSRGIVDQWSTHQFGHLPGTAVTWTSAITATALVHIVRMSSTDSNTKQTRTGLQPAIACKNTGVSVSIRM
jgi:hypothetical protein